MSFGDGPPRVAEVHAGVAGGAEAEAQGAVGGGADGHDGARALGVGEAQVGREEADGEERGRGGVGSGLEGGPDLDRRRERKPELEAADALAPGVPDVAAGVVDLGLPAEQYGMFDLSSFFFNLQRIEESYCRFKRGKEFLERASRQGSPSLYNEFKQLTIHREGLKNISDYDVNRWLSWCTIRNTEVYDAIMSDLRNYEFTDTRSVD